MSTDQNLLYGILAWRAGFASRDDLLRSLLGHHYQGLAAVERARGHEAAAAKVEDEARKLMSSRSSQ